MARRIGAVLIDLSGTIHIDDMGIPGAIEALKRLVIFLKIFTGGYATSDVS